MPHAMIAARRGSHPLLPTATERLVVCWKRRPLPTLLHSFLWAGRHSLHSLIQEQVLTGDSTPVSSSSLLSFHSLSSSAHPLFRLLSCPLLDPVRSLGRLLCPGSCHRPCCSGPVVAPLARLKAIADGPRSIPPSEPRGLRAGP